MSILSKIARCVCEEFEVPESALFGKSVRRRHAIPRQIAYAIAYETELFSLPDIGRFFGGRHHTTVLHGIERVKRELAGKFPDQMERLREACVPRAKPVFIRHQDKMAHPVREWGDG